MTYVGEVMLAASFLLLVAVAVPAVLYQRARLHCRRHCRHFC
jgi:hypothetical protein